jgi:hypothetical protein
MWRPFLFGVRTGFTTEGTGEHRGKSPASSFFIFFFFFFFFFLLEFFFLVVGKKCSAAVWLAVGSSMLPTTVSAVGREKTFLRRARWIA